MMLSKEALETSPEAVVIFRKYTITKNYRNTNTAGIYNDLNDVIPVHCTCISHIPFIK